MRILVTPVLTNVGCWLHLCWRMMAVDQSLLLVTPVLTNGRCWLHLCWPVAGVGYTCVDQWRMLVTVLTNGGCWLYLRRPVTAVGYTFIGPLKTYSRLLSPAWLTYGCAVSWCTDDAVSSWSRLSEVTSWSTWPGRQRHSCSGRNKCLSAQPRP